MQSLHLEFHLIQLMVFPACDQADRLIRPISQIEAFSKITHAAAEIRPDVSPDSAFGAMI